MRQMSRQEFLEFRRRVHEDYLRNRAGEAFHRRGRRYSTFGGFTLDIEGRDSVVRGYGGWFEVRFPREALWRHDALRRRGF